MSLVLAMIFVVIVLFIVWASIKPAPKNSNSSSTQPQASWVPPPAALQPTVPQPQIVYQQTPQVSFREQQIDEFALLMATEYRRMKDDEQRALARESLQVAESYRKIIEQQNAESIHAKAAIAFQPKA